MNELLLSLKQSGAIPPKLYDRVRSSAGKTPLFYGLPKIHKPDVPLRPIASFIHSRSYHLSKHLVTILSPLVGQTDSNIRNSSDFAEFITSQTLSPDETLVSFDVVSLFTNVPVDLASQVASDRLRLDDSLGNHTLLSPDQICTLLKFCLNATFVAYKGVFFPYSIGDQSCVYKQLVVLYLHLAGQIAELCGPSSAIVTSYSLHLIVHHT